MKKGLIINEDKWVLIGELEPEEQVALLSALAAYHKCEEVPDLDRMVRMVFLAICEDNARFDPAKVAQLSAVRAAAGAKGGSKPKQNKQNKQNEAIEASQSEEANPDKRREDKSREDIEKNKRRVFIPPTVEDVREYAGEVGITLNADRFVDFYASKGWKVGSETMKDWKAAARNWARRDRERGGYAEKPRESKYDDIDFTRLLNKTGS